MNEFGYLLNTILFVLGFRWYGDVFQWTLNMKLLHDANLLGRYGLPMVTINYLEASQLLVGLLVFQVEKSCDGQLLEFSHKKWSITI